MDIKKIKKMNNDKYQIITSDNTKIITYDSVILKYNLLYKKNIDSELMSLIMKETSYFDIYKKAVNYISKRLRSEYEIKKYLEKYDLNEKDTNKIINDLKKSNFINDYNFAKSYISDKVYLSNYGPLKIKRDLQNYYIDTEIIEELINNIDDEVILEKLNKLMTKKINSNKKHSNYILKQKLLYYFKDLGYETSMILSCLDNLGNNDDNILDKEYEKLYKKYSKKYSDYNLDNKIKEGLYRKGFDINKINEFINTKKEF